MQNKNVDSGFLSSPSIPGAGESVTWGSKNREVKYYVLILGCLCHRSMYRNGLACVPDPDHLVLQFL